jgi:LacI family transcriptional regulator
MKHDSVRRLATIIDVAARAGVSIKTVSRVLNEERYVDSAKREEVLAVVKALRYTPHPSARNLRRGSSRTIGLAYAIVSGEPGSVIPHYSQGVQLGALDACQRADFGILLVPCQRDSATLPADIVHRAKAHRVSGLVIAAPICNATGVGRALRAAGHTQRRGE